MFYRTKAQETPYIGPAWWHAAIVLAVAVVAQVELVHFVSWHHAEPSLVLLAIVWYALRTDLRRAVIFGFAAGLGEDLLGGSLTAAGTGGSWTIASTLTALAVSSLSQRFFADSVSVTTLAVAVATLLRRWIYWSVMSLEGYPRGLAGVHFHEALWEALLNMVLAAALMLALRVVEARRVA